VLNSLAEWDSLATSMGESSNNTIKNLQEILTQVDNEGKFKFYLKKLFFLNKK
jgi:hypothetical protein